MDDPYQDPDWKEGLWWGITLGLLLAMLVAATFY